MKNEAQELLMEWRELIIHYYSGNLSYETEEFNDILSKTLDTKKAIIAQESEVGSFFLYGAEDMYLGDASGVPAPMDTLLAEELFDYISKGAKVSDVYEGERKEYLEGAEWWHSTSKGEEV